MITKTEYDFLNEKKMNEMITNAYISNFFRNINKNDFNTLLKIIKNNIYNDHSVYKLSCSVCIMNLLKKGYILWKEYKAEGDIQDWVIEKAINNINEDTKEKETIVVEVEKESKPNSISIKQAVVDIKPKPIVKSKPKSKPINKKPINKNNNRKK